MKLNKIAIHNNLIPEKFKKKDFVKEDIEAYVVLLSGTKEEKRRKAKAIEKICGLLMHRKLTKDEILRVLEDSYDAIEGSEFAGDLYKEFKKQLDKLS